MRSLSFRAALVAAAASVSLVSSAYANDFTLTLFHNNDGESKLLGTNIDPDGPGPLPARPYGGVHRFVSVLDDRRATLAPGSNALTLSSGDNFLAGAEFTASLRSNDPTSPTYSGSPAVRTYFDARAINNIGYDALAIGNHEFDFGPDVLAEFISQTNTTFLSANLDFSGEPALQALVDTGKIAKSKVVTFGGEKVGVIGAVTPLLPVISSPRNVVVNDVVSSVQAEITRLTNDEGVNKIVLISHLQNINEELALIPQLSGIDVVIAGGGDELLAKPGTPVVPNQTIVSNYPRIANNFDGIPVPVITTSGEYQYVGQLDVVFDASGIVTTIGSPASNAYRVSGNPSDADFVATPDAQTVTDVINPVSSFTAALGANVIATAEAALNGARGTMVGNVLNGRILAPGVRNQETNLGNLMADSLLWQAQQNAPLFGVDTPVIGFQNGGGIRASANAGNFTELNTFNIAAFSNFVSVIEDLPVTRLKELLEHSVSEIGGGRFGQWAGLRFTFDPRETPQVSEGGIVVTPGSRIIDVYLVDENGVETLIIDNGVILDPAATYDLATIDFLPRQNGDNYPMAGLDFTTLGVTYQQALFNYVDSPLGLNGLIDDALYGVVPIDTYKNVEQAGRRIDAVVPEPSTLGLTALAGVAMLRRRK